MFHLHPAKAPKVLPPDYQPQYYFTVRAKNQRVIVTSETYTGRREAIRGMSALQTAMGCSIFLPLAYIDHTRGPKPHKRTV